MTRKETHRSVRNFWWGLVLLLGACHSPAPAPSLAYPTDQALRVREVCSTLFTGEWWGYFSPSRKSALRSFQPIPGGLVARFADGRRYEVPLQTGLPPETYTCHTSETVTPCASRRDWDQRCEFDPNRQIPRMRY